MKILFASMPDVSEAERWPDASELDLGVPSTIAQVDRANRGRPIRRPCRSPDQRQRRVVNMVAAERASDVGAVGGHLLTERPWCRGNAERGRDFRLYRVRPSRGRDLGMKR
jgi:hypothetical protein